MQNTDKPSSDVTGPQERGYAVQIAFVLMVALLIVAPSFVYPIFIMQALCFALFACAFNLLIGHVGLMSFGHALFFGWASYITAYFAKVGTVGIPYWSGGLKWLMIPLPPLPPELAILAGTAAAGMLGLIVGSLAIRRQGIYFAMITLALAQMMYFVALQVKFTGGEDGLQSVPRGVLFGIFNLKNPTVLYIFVLAIFLFGFLLIHRIVNSPFGEVLKAIRENETRVISLGFDVHRYKLIAFVLSASLAGLAGATKAIVFQLATLTDVHWHMSGEVVLMTLLGGLGTVFGPVVGAFFIVGMQNYLAAFNEWVTVIQGIIFILCVLLFRRGMVGELAAIFRIKL